MTSPLLSGVICLTLTVLHNNIVRRVVESEETTLPWPAPQVRAWQSHHPGHDQASPVLSPGSSHVSQLTLISCRVIQSLSITTYNDNTKCNININHTNSLDLSAGYFSHILEAIGLCVLFGFVNGEYVRGLFFTSDMHQINLTRNKDDRDFYLSLNSVKCCVKLQQEHCQR